MSGAMRTGLALERVLPALRRLEPAARACYVYDLDLLSERARRFREAFEGLPLLTSFALKANPLPAIVDRLAELGFGAEAGSLGELELLAATKIPAERRVLNGNGRTPEEAAWVARHGVHSVNADHVGELDLLEREAAAAKKRVRVALRVNPGVTTSGHPYVATGHGEAKFGISPGEALDALRGSRWPHLVLDGLHVHVGSQLLDPTPLANALEAALYLCAESARRGAPVKLLNMGGGIGVDYTGEGAEFPLETWAEHVRQRMQKQSLELVMEPGRWLVAPVGVLLAEVLWVKERDGKRFVVIAAGMNDLLRPALYKARHRIEPVRPRDGKATGAAVVGPVCESADVFADHVILPPLESGDLLMIRDVGAYGAAMASNYNGRGRLAELVMSGGTLMRARAGEGPEEMLRRRREDVLEG